MPSRLVALLLLLAACDPDLEPAQSSRHVDTFPEIRIAEIHYDNTGTDVDEAIELSGPAGASLAGWQVVLYNGAGGVTYATQTLSGTVPATCTDRGVVVLPYPVNGIQNGSPDGIALVSPAGAVVQFLSYEGTFTATNGPAIGLVSTDIGRSETGTEPVGQSLSRDRNGYWTGPKANSFGACNDLPSGVGEIWVTPPRPTLVVGGTMTLAATVNDVYHRPIPGAPLDWASAHPSIASVDANGVVTALAPGEAKIVVSSSSGPDGWAVVRVEPTALTVSTRFNEVDYRPSTWWDITDDVEIEGPAGQSIDGWKIVLYDGASGQPYHTRTLTGTIPSTCGARGVRTYSYSSPTLQNGAPDGLALLDATGQVLEFISYEGTFTATSGPAIGRVSVNIGSDLVTSSATLQRQEGGWQLAPGTLGACPSPTPVCAFREFGPQCQFRWSPSSTRAQIQAEASSLPYGHGQRVVSIAALPGTSPIAYAVVTEKVFGPNSPMLWEITEAALPAALDGWAGQGVGPVGVAVSGSDPATARYTVVGRPGALTDLVFGESEPDFISIANGSRAEQPSNRTLEAVAVDGGGRYAAILRDEPTFVPWDFNFGTAAEATTFIALAKAMPARPTRIAQSTSGRFVVAHHDDDLVGVTEMPVQVPGASLDSEVATWLAAGYRLIGIAPGSGVYSLTFEKPVAPATRQWTATGSAPPSQLAPIEQAVLGFMKANRVRSGSIAVVKDGRLVLARGYTWAAAGYPVTQPTSTFRSASIAKPIAAMAVMTLVQNGVIALTDKLLDRAPTVVPPGADPRLADVTIDHLLVHRGGWDRAIVGDVMWDDVHIATELGVPLPLTLDQIGDYNFARPMQHTPGTTFAYSNFGYCQLGRVIEAQTGLSYEAYVRQALWDPIGVPARTRAAHLAPSAEEVPFVGFQPYLSLSAYQTGVWTSWANGGFNLETGLVSGKWLVAAPDYARLLVALASREILDETNTQTMLSSPYGDNQLRGPARITTIDGVGAIDHGGSMPGTATRVWLRDDGVAVVMLFARDVPSIERSRLTHAINLAIGQVTSWPATDLFPAMGL